MSILNKLMDTMRLTENDDDYLDEEDYEEDYPEPGWYIQLSSDYGDVSTPVSDIGRDFFITQDEALQAREDSEEMKRCQ